jgi:hypothetical protein
MQSSMRGASRQTRYRRALHDTAREFHGPEFRHAWIVVAMQTFTAMRSARTVWY